MSEVPEEEVPNNQRGIASLETMMPVWAIIQSHFWLSWFKSRPNLPHSSVSEKLLINKYCELQLCEIILSAKESDVLQKPDYFKDCIECLLNRYR
jgi:hypothetical protein